jgi:hypothetical protein
VRFVATGQPESVAWCLYRCIRSSRATSADEAHIPGGAPAVVTSNRRLVGVAIKGENIR